MTRKLLALLLCLALLGTQCNAAAPLGLWASSTAPTTHIQNIQPVSITIPSGQLSATTTITSVNTAKAALFNQGFTATSASADSSASSRIEITNATTVTCYRAVTNSDATTCAGTVVEFKDNINSIQAGTIGLSAIQTSNTATISAVSSQAFVIWLGATTVTAETSYSREATSVALTNSTTVTASVGLAGAVLIVGYMVVDPTSTLVASAQQVSHTDATSATSYTDTITSVPPEHTTLAYNGCTIATGTSPVQFVHTLTLTNATTVTLNRSTSGANTTTRTCNYEVVNWAAGLLNGSVQRGTSVISAATSKTMALPYPVNTAKSFVNFAGFLTTGTAPNVVFPTVTLTNPTTVTAVINSTGTTTTSQSVIQFN